MSKEIMTTHPSVGLQADEMGVDVGPEADPPASAPRKPPK
jgi:hypothetical protein